MDNQQQMLWMDEDFTAPEKPKTPEERAAELEKELQQARKELADVRKDLAAKVGRMTTCRIQVKLQRTIIPIRMTEHDVPQECLWA